MARDYDLAVYIGRFRPFHVEHQHVVDVALERADRLLILVGSAGEPRSARNPFTFDEVWGMIRACNAEAFEAGRILIAPIVDSRYKDSQWLADVNKAVAGAVAVRKARPRHCSIALIGHDKQDGTGYYLKWFPQWASIPVHETGHLSATHIRQQYFMFGEQYVRHCDGKGGKDGIEFTADVPTSVRDFLAEFMKTSDYHALCAEVEHAHHYKIRLQGGSFPNQPSTADAMVYHGSGHVLLVKRKNHPGKGLWALPGGFVNPTETRLECAIRELKEETGIGLSEETLRSLIVAKEDFDDIHRDPRARIFTMTYLIKLRAGDLPKLKAGDAAAAACWWNVSSIRREMMVFDHYDIIQKLLGYV